MQVPGQKRPVDINSDAIRSREPGRQQTGDGCSPGNGILSQMLNFCIGSVTLHRNGRALRGKKDAARERNDETGNRQLNHQGAP